MKGKTKEHKCIFCGSGATKTWEVINDHKIESSSNVYLCELHYVEASTNARKKRSQV